MNLIEALIAKKAALDLVLPGDKVTMTPDIAYISSEYAEQVITSFYDTGYKNVARPERTLIVGHCSKAKQFCHETGILHVERKLDTNFLFDLTGEREGLIVTADPNRYDLSIDGYIALPVSPFVMAQTIATGTIDFIVPETVYIEMAGTKKWTAESLYELFRDSLVGNAVIIGGKAVESVTKAEREELARFFRLVRASLGAISPSGPKGQVESVVKIKDFLLS